MGIAANHGNDNLLHCKSALNSTRSDLVWKVAACSHKTILNDGPGLVHSAIRISQSRSCQGLWKTAKARNFHSCFIMSSARLDSIVGTRLQLQPLYKVTECPRIVSIAKFCRLFGLSINHAQKSRVFQYLEELKHQPDVTISEQHCITHAQRTL